MTITRRTALFLAACLAALLGASAARAQPSDEEVHGAVRKVFGPGIEAHGFFIEHGVEAALNTGFGSTRVSGLLDIVEPLYAYDEKAFLNALAERGITDSEAGFHARRMNLGQVTLGRLRYPAYRQVEEPRSFVPFAVDFTYVYSDGSYWFSSSSADPIIEGDTFGELPQGAVIVGSPAFEEWVERFVEASAGQRDYQERAKQAVEQLLAGRLLYASGPKDASVEPVRLVDRYSMQFPASFTWELVQPDQLDFSGSAHVTFLRDDVRWANTDYQEGETLETPIGGSVHLDGAGPTIYLRTGGHPLPFKITGLAFDGTPFSEEAQPPLRGVELATPWSALRVSRKDRVRFDVAEGECVEFHSARVGSDEALVYFAGPGAEPEFRGAGFIVAGPVHGAILTFSENQRIRVDARRYPQDQGSCQQ